MFLWICLGVGLISGGLFFWSWWFNEGMDSAGVALSIAVFALGTTATVVIGLIIAGCAIDAGAKTAPINETRTELVALQDEVGVSGRRYVYKSELQYNYLYNQEGKGITGGTAKAENTYVNYIAEGETPYIIGAELDFANPFLRAITPNILSYQIEYYLYIPEGSITAEEQYNIDLE